MLRLFEQHEIRKTKELNGMWDFVREDIGMAYRIPVSGCWEQHPDMITYRGQGTSRTKVKVEQDSCLRLEFKGAATRRGSFLTVRWLWSITMRSRLFLWSFRA